jgi:4-hydroxybenzoate polyprenyltransferase
MLHRILKLLRPLQLSKSLFCLAGVVFGPNRLEDEHAWGLGLWTVLVFMLGSSAVYVLNDVIDRHRDAAHPHKRLRPIASGEIGLATALSLAAVLLALALAVAWKVHWAVFICLGLYLLNNMAYSLWLRHLALVDVLSIALGFVLRLLAGVWVLDDVPTTWIVLCTFFLALFLGFAKRRAELDRLVEGAGPIPRSGPASADDAPFAAQRPVLADYTVQFLDYLVNSAAMMTVMCYALFTTTSGKSPTLVVTVPIVFYAVMHYKRLVMIDGLGEEPERLLLTDLPLQLSLLLWLVVYFAVLFGNLSLFR